MCDNTLVTPVLQRPLDLGLDFVVHATTTYLDGHADVLGSAVVGGSADGLFQRITNVQARGGALPFPFDGWLVPRSIGTPPYRMRTHCDNAMAVAAFLDSHPGVEAVHYPGLDHRHGHNQGQADVPVCRHGILPGEQWQAPCRGGRGCSEDILTRATSFEDSESLIEHRASIGGSGTATPEDLLRMSIGLENPGDQVEDLVQALDEEISDRSDGDFRG